MEQTQGVPAGPYTVEKHGNGFAIYTGRTPFHHGINWGQLTGCSEALATAVERGLNMLSAAPQAQPVEAGDLLEQYRRDSACAVGGDAQDALDRALLAALVAQPVAEKPAAVVLQTFAGSETYARIDRHIDAGTNLFLAPAAQPVEAERASAVERLEKMLWDAIDYAAKHPTDAKLVDKRTWQHLMVYQPAQPVEAEQATAPAPVTVLPDGSAFMVASLPLPTDHWLYAERVYIDGHDEPVELPTPITTHADRDRVEAAIRYAVRGATMCGKEMDFDPDALVLNAIYALCGPFGGGTIVEPAQPEIQTPTQPAQPVEAEQAENLRRDYARALDTIKGHAAQIGVLEQHIRELRAFQAMVNRHAPEFPDDPDGPRDVWYWQGDGRDHLESMTHQLPVVIRAEQLRELLAARPAQPVREPMSWDLFVAACEAEYGEEFCPNNLGDVSDEEKAELMRVVSIVERHHGIGSKGGA